MLSHAHKLLDNVTQWTGLVAPDTLQEVVLDGLLNRYLLLSLQNSPPGLLSLRKAEAVSGLCGCTQYTNRITIPWDHCSEKGPVDTLEV